MIEIEISSFLLLNSPIINLLIGQQMSHKIVYGVRFRQLIYDIPIVLSLNLNHTCTNYTIESVIRLHITTPSYELTLRKDLKLLMLVMLNSCRLVVLDLLKF